MSEVRFKRFTIVNERSAMKVNTDGVLLGAAMTVLPSDLRLLDIGTGTGTVALMVAQRLNDLGTPDPLTPPQLVGIDIDEPSAMEAALNFSRSPWSGMLEAVHLSLADYEVLYGQEKCLGFDAVFSNPPYFETTLQAPDARRACARHAAAFSYRDIISFCTRHLSEQGRLSLILPAEQERDLCRFARMNSLFPFRILRIRTVSRKPVVRIVAEFSRQRAEVMEEELVIHEKGAYSDEYRALTHDFYLSL